MFNFVAAVSLLLWAAAAACWVVGAVQPRPVSAWTIHSSPERSWFVRLERQHLVVSEQRLVPRLLPAGFAVDSTRFRHFGLHTRGLLADGHANAIHPDSWMLNPSGAWFRKFRTPATGYKIYREDGTMFVDVAGQYGAVEVPWWSLLLAFALPPGLWLVRQRRARTRRRRGLCPACGYDLRASPDCCPECGTASQSAQPAA